MIIRFVLAACAVMMLAGCGVVQISESSDESGGGLGDLFSGLTSTGPQWSEYLPVQNGRVCTYTDEEGDFADDTSQTWEYFNVREESDGTHFSVRNAIENATPVELENGESYLPPVITETVEWRLADDGTLRSEPGLFTAEVEPPGYSVFDPTYLDMSSDEFIVFPAISDLRRGESLSSLIAITGRPANPDVQARLQEVLEPGESTLKLRAVYTVEGVPPKEITTPAGTFTDVIGVAVVLEDIETLNVADAEERMGLDSELYETTQSFIGALGKTTTWYARDVGAVQVEYGDGSSSEIPPLKLQGCEG